jgi:N-methylhydantoinase A
MRYVIGIDIGGTCTDCVSLDAAGYVRTAKTFSTPPDFSVGIIDGIEQLARTIGTDVTALLSSTDLFLHSTTVAENAVIDGTMVTAGLVTTSGFEDTLFAMRGGYGRWSGLSEAEKRDSVHSNKPPELIPRSLIRGLDERTGSGGQRYREADDQSIERAVQELLAGGAQSIAVSFLWSFIAPEGERRVEQIVRRLRPGMFVSCSHRVAPVLGEYERTSTTALNARLGPVVGAYITRLQQRLDEGGFGGTLLIMQSYGGLVPASQAYARPVAMIESGPVAGVLGSREVAGALGIRNVIAADMGGTTFKVGIAREGLMEYERESMVLRYHFAAPKVDIASLGLAGGSVVGVDPRTRLPVIGPRSAGAYPGPVCYGNGGTEATVTDVDAILGYLHTDFFLGGGRKLHLDAAREAFEEKVARPLGMSNEQAAVNIYRLANSMIYDMLHKSTVQRGLDPRGFTLVSIGGTAGMHVTSYATRLGVQRIIIPRTASVHSASGLVRSDIVHEEQATRSLRFPVPPEAIDPIFVDLTSLVEDQMTRDGFPPRAFRLMRSIDMRYVKQSNIVSVPVDGMAAFDEPMLLKTVDKFEELYRNRYGQESGYRDAGIEMVTFRVRGIGPLNKPRETRQPRGEPDPKGGLVERRWAWVEGEDAFREIDGYALDRLSAGNIVRGPAIVWSPSTTVVLRRVDSAEVDEFGNLVLAGVSGR